ncbi:uncharacterized protein LOC143184368 isoform X2 [Calliopsis andreniformis]|uniref:uncharacterized protein LOC143184368 isoform X2 n=1 Tax=Calliopsis andreniformis TaxID=337506 RepID=UPI003FCE8550
MLHRCLKLFTRKRSRYVSWNILLLWGFGLWIALCTSNLYHSDGLTQEAVMIYQQNWNSGTAYDIAIKSAIAENFSHVAIRNCTLCSIVFMVTAALQYVYVLLLGCFIIPFICMHKHIKKRIKLSNNIIDYFHSIGTYLKTFTKRPEQNCTLDREIVDKFDFCVLQSSLITTYETSAQYLQEKLIYERKEEYTLEGNKIEYLFNANISIVQDKITFSNYTLLLFYNYGLPRYFNNQRFNYTCFLTNYNVNRSLVQTKSNLKLSNYKKNCNHQLKTGIPKRIISSSPEFQKFVANLKPSRFFYPCKLEVSTSYIIRIKSVYK